MTIFDWIDCNDYKPFKSGIYTVKDIKGRVFDTWFEKVINSFNPIHDNVGYVITHWKFREGGANVEFEIIQGSCCVKEG